MGKYFGTDGARGRVNETLTLDMAVRIGRYLGWHYGKDKQARIVIGKDTRLSGDMFEMGLAAGATSTGADVYLLGICPTPSVSCLVRSEGFDCGVMVSASHNPYYDNGIKLFNSEGCKMNPEIELAIEKYIDKETEVPSALNEHVGRVIPWHEGLKIYEDWLKEIVNVDLAGMRIALDLANGSATATAAQTLRELGAQVDVIHGEPDGVNINTECGSTHPESLQSMVREGHYDVGFAFDGDADRLIAVDEEGNLFNGDYILYTCGRYMKKKRRLAHNMVVTTVMANLGLYHALRDNAIDHVQTAVGDKYVFECMQSKGYSIGGEQSGHIIFLEHAVTGDGLLTALKLLEIMCDERKSLKELGADLFIYPQLLVNVEVKDKNRTMADEGLKAKIAEVEAQLGDEGRILVRPSGTEPLVRVMAEARSDELCHDYVYQIVDFIQENHL